MTAEKVFFLKLKIPYISKAILNIIFYFKRSATKRTVLSLPSIASGAVRRWLKAPWMIFLASDPTPYQTFRRSQCSKAASVDEILKVKGITQKDAENILKDA